MNAPSPPPDRTIPPIAVVLMLVAAMLAGLGWMLGSFAVTSKSAAVRRGWDLVPVMVARRDLKAGAVLRREDVEARSMPETIVTGSHFTDAGALVGKTLAAPVSKGTPLHPASLEGARVCP